MNNNSSGQLLNLISNDASRLELVLPFLPYVIIGPIEVIVVIYIMIKTIDVSILFGLVVLAIVLPAQSLLGKVYDKLR